LQIVQKPFKARVHHFFAEFRSSLQHHNLSDDLATELLKHS